MVFSLDKDYLGKPRLFLGDREGPSLSFSYEEKRLWAAMGQDGPVGIDVAYPEEFPENYPFPRAFNADELECAEGLCRGNRARGAALLWSVKEAAVKAIGTGFHFLDPLDVEVEISHFQEPWIVFKLSAGRSITAWAREERKGWVTLAWAYEQSQNKYRGGIG
jgi:phosphopantetheinyl transferase